MKRVLGGAVGGLILVVALVYVAVGAAFTVAQGRIVFPAPDVPRAALDEAAGMFGATTVELVTADGVRLYGWHKSGGANRAVLFFHGNAETVADRPELHALLVDHGWDVLVVAYRGYPGSEGSPSETGLAADADAAWRWMVEERGVPAERIVLHGKSLGGGVAASLAERHRPAGLVLESTFTSVTAMARLTLPGYPVRLLLRHPFETDRRAPGLTMPSLVLHGSADPMIPVGHALSNAEALPDAELVVVPGAGHGETLPMLSQDAQQAYLRLLTRALGGATGGEPAP